MGKLKKQVYHVPNNKYNYIDGQAICKAYGGRLANYEEMEEAYEKGGNWCSYGWSEDQMALFPTQKQIWDKTKDEYDIPAPFDDHTNIKFRHLEWLGAVDINGYECCPDGIFFSVDKRSWHTPDEIVKWDIYGNTQGIDGDIRLSWNVDSLNMDGIDYNIFMHIEGLPPLDMILNSTKIIPPGTLSSSLPNRFSSFFDDELSSIIKFNFILVPKISCETTSILPTSF